LKQWLPLAEPYPACVDCACLLPCPCNERDKEVDAAATELDRLGGIMPGCCWACNEPVTSRHASIVFDEENLLRPGGGPVVFHTSLSLKAHTGTCLGQAIDYERRWVQAAPGRPHRLTCPGHLFLHRDRSECTEGQNCPGDSADHYPRSSFCTTNLFEVDGTQLRPSRSCGLRGCRGGA
jgi:hypothetical protein